MVRDPLGERIARRQRVKEREAAGEVADSLATRRELMAQVHAGHLSLADAQATLRRLQRNAKKNGLVTRAQAHR